MIQEPKNAKKGDTICFFKTGRTWEVGPKFVISKPDTSRWDEKIVVPPTARVLYRKHSKYIETRVTLNPSFPDGTTLTVLSLT